MGKKKLYRTTKQNKYVAGVCGGIAEYFQIDPTIVRILVAIITFSSWGTGLVIYFVAAIVIPEKPADYVDDEVEVEIVGEEGRRMEQNTKQFLGVGLVAVGGLLLVSRLIPWFDSGILMALGIIAAGVFIVLHKSE